MAPEVPGLRIQPCQGDPATPFGRPRVPAQPRAGEFGSGAVDTSCTRRPGARLHWGKRHQGEVMELGVWSKLRVGWPIREPVHTLWTPWIMELLLDFHFCHVVRESRSGRRGRNTGRQKGKEWRTKEKTGERVG